MRFLSWQFLFQQLLLWQANETETTEFLIQHRIFYYVKITKTPVLLKHFLDAFGVEWRKRKTENCNLIFNFCAIFISFYCKEAEKNHLAKERKTLRLQKDNPTFYSLTYSAVKPAAKKSLFEAVLYFARMS